MVVTQLCSLWAGHMCDALWPHCDDLEEFLGPPGGHPGLGLPLGPRAPTPARTRCTHVSAFQD